jgi:DNA-binding transcriptional LysR family regulator
MFSFLMPNRHQQVSLRQLRAFVAIVDAGGIHRAAARLHLTQPAMSRQLQALEAGLGVPLFDRIGRRLQLTAEGEDLFRRSRGLLAEIEAFSERADALRKGESGLLRVGATPQVIESTLADFLKRYRQRHPGIEVHLLEDGGSNLPARVERGHVHLALTAMVDERFAHRALYPSYDLAVLSSRHALSRRRTLNVAELAEEPLLLLRGGFASRTRLEAAFNVANLKPRVAFESSAPQTVMALAASGHGIAIVPSTVQIPRGPLRAIPLVQSGAPVGRWLSVIWDRQRSLAPYAEQFVDELVPYCRETSRGRAFGRYAPPLPRPKERSR